MLARLVEHEHGVRRHCMMRFAPHAGNKSLLKIVLKLQDPPTYNIQGYSKHSLALRPVHAA